MAVRFLVDGTVRKSKTAQTAGTALSLESGGPHATFGNASK